MRRVYSSQNTMMVGLVKGILDNGGIDCLLKNQILSSGMGELPLNECWPEVWVTHDGDYDKATQIINEFLAGDGRKEISWHCSCGELLEGQFEICWRCGQARPSG